MGLLYYVDLPMVRKAIRSIQTERDDMKTNLDSIAGKLDGASGIWTGPAASTYSGLVDDLKKANTAMIGAIDAITERMQTTADNYHATETENYYTFGGA